MKSEFKKSWRISRIAMSAWSICDLINFLYSASPLDPSNYKVMAVFVRSHYVANAGQCDAWTLSLPHQLDKVKDGLGASRSSWRQRPSF